MSLSLGISLDDRIPPNQSKIATCRPSYPRDWERHGMDHFLEDGKIRGYTEKEKEK